MRSARSVVGSQDSADFHQQSLFCAERERCDLDNGGTIGQGDMDILLSMFGTPESQTPADYVWNDAGQLAVRQLQSLFPRLLVLPR